jgi:hypothetical protein
MVDGFHITLGARGMPANGDIEIKIDFREDEGSPARIFDIAAGIIRSFEDIDRALIDTIDSSISTELILEDVEKSSLRVVLKNILEAVDDAALRDLDWRKQVGKYLVKGKYAAIEWLDKKPGAERIEDLTERLRDIAAETDVRRLPDYAPISPTRLAQPLDEFQRIKRHFRPGEGLLITLGKEEYSVNLKSDWLPSEHIEEARTAQDLSNDIDMVVTIRKPDLLGKSMWQFRHGKKSLSAMISDEAWLKEFHEGKHPVVPGDALRVRARIEAQYDDKGALVEERTSIIKVYGKINPGLQTNIFGEDGSHA